MVPLRRSMSRHRSLLVGFERAARAAARAQREREAAQRRQVRDELRNQHEAMRLQQVRARLAKEQRYWSKQEEGQALTRQLNQQIIDLQNVLARREHTT